MNTIALGASAAFLSVVLGAFATHGLKNSLDSYALGIFHTGTTYQMYHSLALLLLGALEPRLQTKLDGPAWCFVIGMVIFSGSLYVLAMSGQKFWGVITPLGGIAFLVGWAWLARIALR